MSRAFRPSYGRCRYRNDETRTLAAVLSAIGILLVAISAETVASGTERVEQKWLITGIVGDGYYVTADLPHAFQPKGDLVERSLTVFVEKTATMRRIAYLGVRSRCLEGHGFRIQAASGSIWQIQLETMSFYPWEASSHGAHCVDTTPTLKITESLGLRPAGAENLIVQRLSAPISMLAVDIASQFPKLEQSHDNAIQQGNLRPLMYYDFAVTRMQSRTGRERGDPLVEGILFLHHRYEAERFLLAVRFPVGSKRPTWEKLDIPFSEPFYCAVDAEGGYYFLTESGRAYEAPKADAGKPRQVKPMFDESKWRVRALIRDAKSGLTIVFAQNMPGSAQVNFMVALEADAKRRELPATFFSEVEDKATSGLLWKCAKLVRQNR